MAFWNRKKNWEDQYDEYYAQDRRAEPAKRPGRFRVVPHLFLLMLLGALFVGGVGLVSGPTMVEKLLTTLAMPVGLVWVGLLILVYFSVLNRQTWPAMAGFGCWLILTLAGNTIVSDALARSLESPYEDIDIFEVQPFDTIMVLGGGTQTTRQGRAELGDAGDRIAVAARMYHAGQVKRLICTGTQTFRNSEKDLHPREEATEILIGLGVPAQSILQIKGQNTSVELANLKNWTAENEPESRIGILTSAWHLPRAMRLAERQGLKAYPVPSDFITGPFVPTPTLIVPGAGSLAVTGKVVKEYLARLIGR